MNNDNLSREEYVSARSEMTKHLHRVHLILVGTCFIFFITSTLTPSDDIERAFDQAQIALLIDQRLTNDWLRNKANALSMELVSRSRPSVKMPSELLGTHILFYLDGRLEFGLELDSINTSPIFYLIDEYVEPQLKHAPPRSVHQFREAWDLLWSAKAYTLKPHKLDLSTIEVPPDAKLLGSWKVTKGTGKESICYLRASNAYLMRHPKDKARLALSLGPWERSSHRACGSRALSAFNRNTFFLVSSFNVEEVPLHFLPKIIEDAGATLSTDSFHGAFYDLASIADGLDSLKLTELRDYIVRLRTKKPERVEVIGIQIPLAAISLWGTALILTLQTYFLLHLRRFYLLKFHYDPVASWFGIYPDTPARFIFQISVSILPVATVLTLAIKAFLTQSDFLSVWVAAIGAFFATILGIITYIQVNSMHKEVKKI